MRQTIVVPVPVDSVQIMFGAAHEDVHAPAAQLSPLAQAWPQLPQFVRSVCVLVQPPVHIVMGAVHVTMPHVPPVQDWPVAQAWPQLPQFAVSVESFTHAVPQMVSIAVHIPPSPEPPPSRPESIPPPSRGGLPPPHAASVTAASTAHQVVFVM